MNYSHDESYYSDIYDLYTIKECLRIIHFWQKAYKEKLNDEKIKDLPLKEKIKGFNYFMNWELYGTKGERFRRRKEWIQKRIAEDKKKQEFYDTTPEPSNITCNSCGKKLISDTRMLEDYMDEPMKVLFFFTCKICKKKRAVYNTGEEFESKPALCPKCGNVLTEKHKTKNKGDVIVWIKSCASCKFHEEEIDDFSEKRAERKKRNLEDKELLEKHRDDFCISEEKGNEYINFVEKAMYAKEVFEEEKEKFASPVYQKSIRLKKLSIVDLENTMNEVLTKEKYVKLSFEKPEMGRFVIVPFTTQDADSSRKGFESTKYLEKILKNLLDETNWRLVNNNTSYRLGYITGKLKGYEREEDLWELEGRNKEQKKVEKDSERKMKYGSDNMVQLARMMGKSEGIENARKERLEREPEGFLLEESEGYYNCRVCREVVSGNKAWWDLNGVKCLDCQRNIKEGVVPAEICNDDDIWLKDWQLSSDFSLHGSTIRKLKREGVLKGRELKREDGLIYCTIYLLEENKDFLEKYPRKPKIKMKYIDPLGKEIEL